MKGLLSILFILMFTVTLFGVNEQSAYAETITVKSIGMDYSSILELKNNRGNNFNIDSVRIWLSEDSSFKSFKTENGWTGKFETGGKVLDFSPQDSVKPGESVKFGLKTNVKNPVINWKALDDNEQIIQTSVVVTQQHDVADEIIEINQPKITAIKSDSTFRLIPEKPTIGSDFRIIGSNFVPNQNVAFYIGDQRIKSISIDSDGKFIDTITIPDNIPAKRTDFILTDSGGTEKKFSLRLYDNENRVISDEVKISISHTSKTVKRGEIVTIKGNATPDATLTLTATNRDGDILNIATVNTNFDGKWLYENLFPVDLKLGLVTIEVTDGRTTVLRGFDVISSQLINISSEQKRYEVGDKIKFIGTAMPNKELTVILEDPIGAEYFSNSIQIDNSGEVSFDVDISMGTMEGTYVLNAFQGREKSITAVGIGEQPSEVMIITTEELNYSSDSTVDVTIQGQPKASVAITIIDDGDNTKINTTVDLDANGNYTYFIPASDLGTGAFTVEVRHGNTRGTTIFTVGLSTGSGPITFQLTKNDYSVGDILLVLGKTGDNSIINVDFIDPDGNTIRTVETFSDTDGIFKIDDFRIPSNAKIGQWSIKISSGENSNEQLFSVVEDTEGLKISSPISDSVHKRGEILSITGTDAEDSMIISISTALGTPIDRLIITAKSNGDFYTIWAIPTDLEPGIYEISIEDPRSVGSVSININ